MSTDVKEKETKPVETTGEVDTEEQIWAELKREEASKSSEDDTVHQMDEDVDKGEDPPDKSGGESSAEGEEQVSSDASQEQQEDVTSGGESELEKLRRENETLLQKLKSEQGRHKVFQQETERLRRQIAAGEEARSKRADEERRKESREKLNKAKEEYGEILEPVVGRMEELESEIDSIGKREIEEAEEAQKRLNDLYQEQQAIFLEKHEDGFQVVKDNSETFLEWIEDQPKVLRDIFEANRKTLIDGEGAALLVGKFKEALLSAKDETTNDETEKLQERRQQQLRGSADTTPTGRQGATSEPSDSEDPDRIWDYWRRREKAGL